MSLIILLLLLILYTSFPFHRSVSVTITLNNNAGVYQFDRDFPEDVDENGSRMEVLYISMTDGQSSVCQQHEYSAMWIEASVE